MNLTGWIGVAAPPGLGRVWRRKVKGETGIENNKRNGNPKNLIFFLCFKKVSKATLRAICRLVLFYLQNLHWALQTVPGFDLGLKSISQCLLLLSQSRLADDPGKGGKSDGVGERGGNAGPQAAGWRCSGKLLAWVVPPKLG